MSIIINPGTGPVRGACEENALENMRMLVKDARLEHPVILRRAEHDYGQGRFAYSVFVEDKEAEVQMPGLPLEQVRYTGAEEQNIWDFPRLYVEGSSWVWRYAVNVLSSYFKDEEEHED